MSRRFLKASERIVANLPEFLLRQAIQVEYAQPVNLPKTNGFAFVLLSSAMADIDRGDSPLIQLAGEQDVPWHVYFSTRH